MMKIQRHIILFLTALCFTAAAFGQKDKNICWDFNAGYGFTIETTNFLRGNNIDGKNIDRAVSFSLQLRKHTDGSKAWHHKYNDLHYGLGLYHARFNYSKNLNNPYGVYCFFGFTPYQNRKFAFITDIAVGLSFVWDYFSSENPYNDAVSMPAEAYVHGRITGQYNINSSWAVNAGLQYVHFSNGMMLRPNMGINIPTAQIGMTYYPDKIKKYAAVDTVNFRPKWDLLINPYYAIEGVFVTYNTEHKDAYNNPVKDTARSRYSVFGLQMRFQRSFSFQHSLGLGFEAAYNDYFGKNAYYFEHNRNDTLSFSDKAVLSTFLTYEYHINKMSIVIEPSLYLHVYRQSELPVFFQRIGTRYNVYKGMYVQMLLRAHNFHVADFIEWGLGYKF